MLKKYPLNVRMINWTERNPYKCEAVYLASYIYAFGWDFLRPYVSPPVSVEQLAT